MAETASVMEDLWAHMPTGLTMETVGVMETCATVAQVSPWAETVDAPIRLARFDCCGRYVCHCWQGEEA